MKHQHHDHSVRAKRLGKDLLRASRALANTPTDTGANEGPWSDAWHAKDDADLRFAECVRHLPGGRDEGPPLDTDALDF